MVQRERYGLWKSPLTPVAMGGALRLTDVQWDTDGTTLVWHERRGGRGVMLSQQGTEAPFELTDESLNVRAGLAYGGGDFTVAQGHVIFVANNRLYRLPLIAGEAVPLTPAFGQCAAPTLSANGQWIAYCHSDQATDRVLVVDSGGRRLPQVLAGGSDFQMQPTWHPQGTHLAYIAYDFPNMPWNTARLQLVTIAYDKQGNPYNAIEETLTHGEDVSVFQPAFSPDGRYLSYVSDVSGWGQLYLYDLAEGTHTAITTEAAEHGAPNWIHGQRAYGWTADCRSLFYVRRQRGFSTVWRYDVQTQTHIHLDALSAYTHLEQISVSPRGDQIALIASSSTQPTQIICLSETTGVRVVRRATGERMPASMLSSAQPIEWPSHDGETAYGLYYAPVNTDYEGIGLPPLMVLVHGGPTSQRHASYDGEVQFFTTRGYAVLQVNHRGSTGYGKPYLNKLRHQWGVYDAEDTRTGAQYLASKGWVDNERMVVMGGSAGGFTVLMALSQFPGVFRAGVCLYGVANQFTIAMDADFKFESRYYDWLLGPLPEHQARWRASSPVYDAHLIQDALLVFQGSDDNVVPKSQSDEIVAALRRNGVTHEYIVYEGEGHGFRQPATLTDLYTRIDRFLTLHVIYGA